MNKRNLFTVGGVAALSFALIALPAPSANSQGTDESTIARLERKLARLEAKLEGHQQQDCPEAQLRAMLASAETVRAKVATEAEVRAALAQEVMPAVQELQANPAIVDGDDDAVSVLIDEEGASWLGVELHEVTSENVKEYKLAAERGVILGKVVPDSPAAKAGLKENDVVTEINGQRIEGSAQFRRMIREIPAGRSVQLTIWRDGRAQNVNVTLGKAEERRHSMKLFAPGTPGAFAFTMPEIPEIPTMEWNGTFLVGGQPRLGIDAEDLDGQLGNFFGAPDGEGILVREVNPDSPAEKAGVKAGDVITTFDGERVRTLSELRERLAAKKDAKDRTVKLGVLRNRSQISLNVELPAPTPRAKRLTSHRTSI